LPSKKQLQIQDQCAVSGVVVVGVVRRHVQLMSSMVLLTVVAPQERQLQNQHQGFRSSSSVRVVRRQVHVK
jgi:hypothetical protein